MKPESPLFNHAQFEAAISQQDQRERVNRTAETVIDACKSGTITRAIDIGVYDLVIGLNSIRYGSEAKALPNRYGIHASMGREAEFRFAPAAHDHFAWEMIEGESYFAVLEAKDLCGEPQDVPYDVMRLINAPAGAPTTADERGLYIARRRDDSGETVMFKIADNPNYQQQVAQGGSVVDDNQRTLARQVITDERQFIPQPLTPEEAIAAADELELAAGVYLQNR